jgi:hypothetical protein
MARGELYTDYQPIVTTVDGQITGFEALLRWAHPTRGLVAPTTLVPLAEQSGLITNIGRWVLEQAWTDRRRWRSDHGGDDFAMSVNVSAHQFMSAGFAATVVARHVNAPEWSSGAPRPAGAAHDPACWIDPYRCVIGSPPRIRCSRRLVGSVEGFADGCEQAGPGEGLLD